MSERMVMVVDDDAHVRQGVADLLEAEGYAVRAFADAADFLAQPAPSVPACLILDMQMPQQDGMSVLQHMAARHVALPVIFLTGHGTIPLSVAAMKAGANEFLTKPVDPDALLAAVDEALAGDASRISQRREADELARRHAQLTPREREVFGLAIGGLLNKQIADAMGVSEIMAKVHKRNLMQKMQTRTLAELVRMAERLGIESARRR
ncbi:response regulator [Massilia pinisoli]|uniref:Response regulator n=1 Tax=Massilia pinisoli TaxID=1772194 RepID=A0ABT1ZZ47_9BURK|nr:response regulator [Massilia pinisoli]MCS0585149.1 response regulator [Massilia pinisoli]